jgi:long-chain fatty acid transport protein
MLTWGSVDLDKALVSGSSMDLMLKYQGVDYSFGETAPASVNLNGTTKVAFGVNVGAMYDITKQVTVGASFRSKMGMKVESGDAHVRYANAIAQQALQSTLDLINDANFSAEMPCPYVFNVGISYKPIEKLTLAFDAQLTGWSTYKSLDIDFIGDKLDAFDQSLTKNYKDSWTYHLGAQYALTNRTDVRLGLMLDTSPCNTDYYNPETPGMTKLEPSVGFSFRPINGFSIDLAFLYVAGLGVDGATGQYDDFIMKRLTSQTEYLQNFTADYKVHALIPSIGLSYSF